MGATGAPWPSLVSSPAPNDLIEWIQSHTYFCDATHWEDLLPSQLVFSSAGLIEKQEEISEKAAKVSARVGRVIRPGNFRGVLAGQYFLPGQMQPQSQADAPTPLERLESSEFKAWIAMHKQVVQAAESRTELTPAMLLGWAQSLTPSAADAPAIVEGRSAELAALVAELNAALWHPRQASARDKKLLRDAEKLLQAYPQRFVALAAFSAHNDRVARAVLDYAAIARGWPPVLVRAALDDVSALGALKAVILMDRCLDRVLAGTVKAGSDCEQVE